MTFQHGERPRCGWCIVSGIDHVFRETTFIMANGSTMTIRLNDSSRHAMVKAALSLGASCVVAFVAPGQAKAAPCWGVFPVWKLGNMSALSPSADKLFPIDAHDAAVVYAAMLRGRN